MHWRSSGKLLCGQSQEAARRMNPAPRTLCIARASRAAAPFCQAVVISSIMQQMRYDVGPAIESDGARRLIPGGGHKARRAPSARQPHDIARRGKRGGAALNMI